MLATNSLADISVTSSAVHNSDLIINTSTMSASIPSSSSKTDFYVQTEKTVIAVRSHPSKSYHQEDKSYSLTKLSTDCKSKLNSSNNQYTSDENKPLDEEIDLSEVDIVDERKPAREKILSVTTLYSDNKRIHSPDLTSIDID